MRESSFDSDSETNNMRGCSFDSDNETNNMRGCSLDSDTNNILSYYIICSHLLTLNSNDCYLIYQIDNQPNKFC